MSSGTVAAVIVLGGLLAIIACLILWLAYRMVVALLRIEENSRRTVELLERLGRDEE